MSSFEQLPNKKVKYSDLLVNLNPTTDSEFKRYASMTITSSGGGSTETSFNGNRHIPPRAVSTCK